jgi:DNA polymerase alpha subunit B
MDNSLRRKLETVFYEAGTPLDDKLLSECTFLKFSLYLGSNFEQPLGVSLCQTFVLDPETLRFKLEALNYTSSATMSKIRPITMDSLIALKTQIQQGLTKENARKAQPKTRGITTAQIDRSKIPSHMSRNVVKPNAQIATLVKQEHSGESSGLTALGNNILSNVTFVGPPADSEARKKRACEW